MDLNNYIAEKEFLDGKTTLLCRECRESMAILEFGNRFRRLAFRGDGFRDEFRPKAADVDFLMRHGQTSRVALRINGRVYVTLPDFSDMGLFASFSPDSNPRQFAGACSRFGRSDLLFAPSMNTDVCKPKSPSAEDCLTLSEQFYYCDRITSPEPDADFRLHCARVAAFAGCRADVRNVPMGYFPLPRRETARWTAFLLCLFLSFRTDSRSAPAFRMQRVEEDRLVVSVSHTPGENQHSDVDGRFAFLAHPAFQSFRLCRVPEGFWLEVTLPLRSTEPALCAPCPAMPLTFLFTIESA